MDNQNVPRSELSQDSGATNQSQQSMMRGRAAKKPKGKMIAIICAAVIVLGGLIGGLIWWMNSSKPENVVLSSVMNLVKADYVTQNTTINITPKDTSSVKSAKIEMSSTSRPIPAEFDGTLTITTVNDGQIALNIAGQIADDGAIYAKVDGLSKLSKEVVVDTFSSNIIFESLTDAQKQELEGIIETELIGNLGTQMDGKWWKFTAADEALGLTAAQVTEYNCVMTELKKISTDATAKKAVANTYKKNAFFDVESRDGDKYVVSLDKTKANSFLNDAENLDALKALANCGAGDDTYAQEIIDTLAGAAIEMEISGGQLKTFTMSYSNDNETLDLTTTFNYDEKTITAPENWSNSADIESNLIKFFADFARDLTGATNSASGSSETGSDDANANSTGDTSGEGSSGGSGSTSGGSSSGNSSSGGSSNSSGSSNSGSSSSGSGSTSGGSSSGSGSSSSGGSTSSGGSSSTGSGSTSTATVDGLLSRLQTLVNSLLDAVKSGDTALIGTLKGEISDVRSQIQGLTVNLNALDALRVNAQLGQILASVLGIL